MEGKNAHDKNHLCCGKVLHHYLMYLSEIRSALYCSTRLGTIEDETIFKSNGKGNLFVSMINPVRIAEAREMVLQIKAADGTEIIKSRPFRLEN